MKRVLCLGVAAALIAAGCGNKKQQEKKSNEFSQMPALTEEPAAGTEATDIFDEFYESEQKPAAVAPRTTSRASSYSGSSPQFVEGGRYVVQVSTVASHTLAESNVAKLQAEGYPAYVAEVQNPTPELIGTYYRVRIGGFTGISAARQFGNDFLTAKGYDYWVDNKSNDNVGIEGYGLGSSAPSSDYGSGSTPAATSTYYEPAPATGGGYATEPVAPATSSGWESSQPAAVEPAPAAAQPAPAAAQPAPAAVEPAPATPAPAASTPAAQPGDTQQGTTWEDDGWGDTDW